jgi:hypothetical protein
MEYAARVSFRNHVVPSSSLFSSSRPKENSMKNTILRILISASLLSFISSIVVAVIGLLLEWKSFNQYSDGFFWAGAILISSGLLSILGMHNQPIMPYSQSGLYLSKAEKAKQWAADISQGYNVLVFLGTSGLLLFGLSVLAILVGNSF